MDHPDILTSGIDIHSTLNTIVEILKKINQRSIHETGNVRGISDARFDDQESSLDLAPPIKDRSHKVIALVTEGGLVPLGNPDRLESAKSKRFLRYSLRGIDDLRSSAFESVSGGWDNRYINADPDRLLPLDVMREIENKAKCLKVHEYFYTTTGAAMSLEAAKKIGESIAQELKRQGVSAVIFTST
jgi:glycine reductase